MAVVAAVLLQRGVSGGAPSLDNGDGAGFVIGHDLDQPEVHQFDESGWGQFDVRGLDIPMQDGRVL